MTTTTAKKAPAKPTAKKAAPAKAPAKKAPAKAVEKTTDVKPERVQIQYYINGVPAGTCDRISRMAFYHTKGIDGAEKRVGVERLREVMAELGATDPEHADFDITLPNGKRIAGKVGVTEPRPARVKGDAKPTDDIDAAERRAKVKLASLATMKEAAAKVKAAGRSTGPSKVTVTKENAQSIIDTEADTWEADDQPKPLERTEVEPRPKAVKASRSAKKVA